MNPTILRAGIRPAGALMVLITQPPMEITSIWPTRVKPTSCSNAMLSKHSIVILNNGKNKITLCLSCSKYVSTSDVKQVTRCELYFHHLSDWHASLRNDTVLQNPALLCQYTQEWTLPGFIPTVYFPVLGSVCSLDIQHSLKMSLNTASRLWTGLWRNATKCASWVPSGIDFLF